MTTIGTINLTTPYLYSRSGYDVTVSACVDEDEFQQMRELFAKANYGSTVHPVPGERVFGEDLTADAVNTVYCTWTHRTSDTKVQDGWYLLRPTFSYSEDDSPEGHAYVYTIRLTFLGTDSYYQACYVVLDLETLDSDWSI